MFNEHSETLRLELASSQSLSSTSSDSLSAEMYASSARFPTENCDDSSDSGETQMDQSLSDISFPMPSSLDKKGKKKEKKGRKGNSFIKSTTSIFTFSSAETKFKKFSSALEKILQSFESIQEWADITSFLLKFTKASF